MGRRKGNKNKIKDTDKEEIKKLKKEIKDLRAKKLLLPGGNQERIELGRELKKLKQLLKEQKKIKAEKTIEIIQANTDKSPLVAEILSLQEHYKITPTFETLGIDLYKYPIENLKKHIECIKRKRGLDKA
jgi:hypothetical protein